jgi:transposase
MNKSTFFSGQPIFTQLVGYVPMSMVIKAVEDHGSDRYYKKFTTYHHLITLLYACFQHCTSLREVTSGMRACEGRLQSLQLRYLPARSTLAEANEARSYEVFAALYSALYTRYHQVLADSCPKKNRRDLLIIDSTTITLFQEILKNAGRRGINGKKKGGIKVHTAIHSKEDVPFLVSLTAANQADVSFLQQLSPPKGSIVVMDRGYNNYKVLDRWTKDGISWITRLRKGAVVEVLEEQPVKESQREKGVKRDQYILLGFKNKQIQQVRCRLITYYDQENKREFQFLTSNKRISPSRIAEYYKGRWQIESLFKRLKQNMQLQYFLGDNENAIKSQIYCTLIADLLLKIVKAGVKRNWSFSGIASIVRLHLMNYTRLKDFLEDPDKCSIVNPVPKSSQLMLNLSG